MSGFLSFAFSEEQLLLRDSLARFLQRECPPAVVRNTLEGREAYAGAVWAGLADLGCLGAAVAETDGGSGLGYVELCIIAEQLGRALAPLPSLSCLYLFCELIKAAGTADQKAAVLGPLCEGRLIGVLAHLELTPQGRARACEAVVRGGRLFGAKDLVPDAMIADRTIVLARQDGDEAPSLHLVRTDDAAVVRTALETIDPTRPYGRVVFDGALAEPLGPAGSGQALLSDAIERAAVFVAFEQVGGAQRALELACYYARGRMAFGRPIGSFQAVKQLLADMYVSLEIARANALRAAWAMVAAPDEARLAAVRAHVSATHAFRHCAADNIQVHGGSGFMWEVDAHLFYRRAQTLAQCLGGASAWERKLVHALTQDAGARR